MFVAFSSGVSLVADIDRESLYSPLRARTWFKIQKSWVISQIANLYHDFVNFKKIRTVYPVKNSKGMNRFLTVTKKEGLDMVEHTAFFTLTRNSRHQVDSLAQKCPLSNKERQELQPRLDRSQYSDGKTKYL